jgi:feruloyl esterase
MRHSSGDALKKTSLLFSVSVAAMGLAKPAFAASCEDIAHLRLPNVVIEHATEITSGVFAEPGPEKHTEVGLPTFCQVVGVAIPVRGSRIGFEVWLPLSGWNSRLSMTGNGTYGANLSYTQMAMMLRRGDVAVATNTGHEAGQEEFAIGRPEAIADWAYRAVHETVVTAKEIIRNFYARAATFSYFAGCSTGGYQALTAAQRYPLDFNGIIAGDPGNNRAPLSMSFLWSFLQNHPRGDNVHEIVSKEKLSLLTRAVVKACDAQDGVIDGVINDPRSCKFDLRSLQCKTGDSSECLTDTEIRTVAAIYQGPRDARTGKQIYPGYTFGSEGVKAYTADRPGWSEYWADAQNPGEPRRTDFFRFWAFNNQNWDWWKFNWGSDVDAVNAGVGKFVNSNSPDLSKFRANGGKLIIYMGWSDPVGPAGEAINYYNSVQALAVGSTSDEKQKYTQESVRLYMVPGMVHCNGGPGASNFEGGTPPLRDAKHYLDIAIRDWVEQGRVPEDIIATKYVNDDEKKGQIQFQRPICVFPKVPAYKGGDKSAAISFECRVPATNPYASK